MTEWKLAGADRQGRLAGVRRVGTHRGGVIGFAGEAVMSNPMRWLISIGLIWKLILLCACSPGSSELDSVIHIPKSGCPPGYTRVPGMFTYHGKAEDACVDPTRPPVTDYLRSGESQTLTIPLTPREPVAQPAKRQGGVS